MNEYSQPMWYGFLTSSTVGDLEPHLKGLLERHRHTDHRDQAAATGDWLYRKLLYRKLLYKAAGNRCFFFVFFFITVFTARGTQHTTSQDTVRFQKYAR